MIPKVFHAVWLGSDLPGWAKEILSSWTDLNPGWKLRLWAQDDLLWLENWNVYEEAEEITSGNPWQLRSDVARYEILLKEGGVYVDCDLEALRSIFPLVEASPDGWLAWEEDRRWIGNTIIAAPPGASWLEVVVEEVGKLGLRTKLGPPAKLSGPQLLSRLHASGVFAPWMVYPQEFFFPFSYTEVKDHLRRGDIKARYPRSYAVHWWMNRRTSRGVPLS